MESLNFQRLVRSLEFSNAEFDNETEVELERRLKKNQKLLLTVLNYEWENILTLIFKDLGIKRIVGKNFSLEKSERTEYLINLMYVIINFVKLPLFDGNDTDGLMKVHDLIAAIYELNDLALLPNIKKLLGEFKDDAPPDYNFLFVVTHFLRKILVIHVCHVNNSMKKVVFNYTSLLFGLLIANDGKQMILSANDIKYIDVSIMNIWCKISKENFMDCLVDLWRKKKLSVTIKKTISKKLMEVLMLEGGYINFIGSFLAYIVDLIKINGTLMKDHIDTISNVTQKFDTEDKEFFPRVFPFILKYLKFCLSSEIYDIKFYLSVDIIKAFIERSSKNKIFILGQIYEIGKNMIDLIDVSETKMITEEFSADLTLFNYLSGYLVNYISEDGDLKYVIMFLSLFSAMSDENIDDKIKLANVITKYLYNQSQPNVNKIILALLMNKDKYQFPHILMEVLEIASNFKVIYNVLIGVFHILKSDEYQKIVKMPKINVNFPATLAGCVEFILKLPPIKLILNKKCNEFAKDIFNILDDKYIRAISKFSVIIRAILTIIGEAVKVAPTVQTFDIIKIRMKRLKTMCLEHDIIRLIESIMYMIDKKDQFIGSEDVKLLEELLEGNVVDLKSKNLIYVKYVLEDKIMTAAPFEKELVFIAFSSNKSFDLRTVSYAVELLVTLDKLALINSIYFVCKHYKLDYNPIVGNILVKLCEQMGSLCYKERTFILDTFLDVLKPSNEINRVQSYYFLGRIYPIITYIIDDYYHKFLAIIIKDVYDDVIDGRVKCAALETLSKMLYAVQHMPHSNEDIMPVIELVTGTLLTKVDEFIELGNICNNILHKNTNEVMDSFAKYNKKK
ncbi:uncharacterized protein LOC119662401 [Teleopsis dalmanni]|uniref:uncharacterized protein LOC119662401 n=1 Tax=Teleopsis dalmanni TaxID=139649 RepID=UPI0018CF7026|nr:uncharacterized protein LOC119662401 [Teleopsis dalmanni]